MSDVAIHVENLSKEYQIGQLHRRNDTLRDAIMAGLGRLRRPSHSANQNQKSSGTFWALKDVSFEVKRGEVMGIIGHNGAGKSTLLKILSRITEPSSGRAEIHGRVGSLLEVGTGFHQELTGRENVYLSGAMLGMRREEIDRKFDEIVDFAGVEKFLDTPIKRYSSGMNVRLGFAVAAHLEPEILLIDEVLAVGDAEFQKKCLGKMGDVAREGRTVLFVSHKMGAVLSLCPTTIHLSRGEIFKMGPSRQIVNDYLSGVVQHSSTKLEDLRAPGFGNSIRFTKIQIGSDENVKIRYGEPLVCKFSIESSKSLSNLSIGASVFNTRGTIIGSLVTQNQFSIDDNQAITLELEIHNMSIAPGVYNMGFSIGQGGLDKERLDYDIIVSPELNFQILPPLAGPISLDGWSSGWGDIVFQENQLKVLGIKTNQL